MGVVANIGIHTVNQQIELLSHEFTAVSCTLQKEIVISTTVLVVLVPSN